jgi:xylan 1,4-beta-xylosidase
MLRGSLVALNSSGAVPVEDIAKTSVTAAPDIDGIATRNGQSVDILVWNYHDEDVASPAADVNITVSGLPSRGVHVQRSVMDNGHSNAYAVWLKMGSPASPTAAQMQELRAASGLEKPVNVTASAVATGWTISGTLPRQSVVLYHLSW